MVVSDRIKSAAKAVGYTIAAIGVIDLPDQIQRWVKFIQSLRGIEVNWETEILGNEGRWAFTIMGVAVLLWAYDAPSIIWSRLKKPKQGTAPPGFIWMKDAATQLYTEARGRGHLLARIAEDMSGWKDGRLTDGAPDDILDYAATYIAFCKRVPLCGKRAPSIAFEPISYDDVKASRFVGGATRLERTHNESIYFTDLAVKSHEFEELMENVGMDDGYYEATSS